MKTVSSGPVRPFAAIFILLSLAGMSGFAQIVRKPDERSGTSSLSREKDALYMEDVSAKPLKLKTLKDAVVFGDLQGQRRLGVIPAGRLVTLDAIHDKAYRVRGRAEHDDVSGWVGKSFLESLDPKVLENISKMAERHKLVEELIRKKEVAMGMTTAEAERVLGAPTKRSSRVDKAGKVETYEYVTYKNVPQQVTQRDALGRLYNTVVYVKVESGRKTLTFENGIVSSIETSETNVPAGGARIVPGPIEIDMMR
jgi:hypothetical protein